MPLATILDKKIAERGYGHLLSVDKSDADRVKYYRALTLGIAAHQQRVWESDEQTLRTAGKIKEQVNVRVRVEDFVTGRVFYTKDGFDMYDIVSNKKLAENVLDL